MRPAIQGRILAHERPVVALVVGAPQHALADARLDERVDAVRIARRDGQADPSQRRIGQPVAAQPRPRAAAVARLVDAAARPAALSRPGVDDELPGRREQDARVRRIHHDVDRAGVLIDEEHLLPRLARRPSCGTRRAPAAVRSCAPSRRRRRRRGSSDAITIRAMRPVASRPRCFHVWPASVERYTPLPIEMLPRMNASPVPAHTTLGSDEATASAPIDATCWPSKIAVQWTPPSSVLKMPPDAAPA